MNVWAWRSCIKLSISAKMDLSLGWDFVNIKQQTRQEETLSVDTIFRAHPQLPSRSGRVAAGPAGCNSVPAPLTAETPGTGFEDVHSGTSIIYQGSENPHGQEVLSPKPESRAMCRYRKNQLLVTIQGWFREGGIHSGRFLRLALGKASDSASWGQLSCPDGFAPLPPPREQGMCVPSTPSPGSYAPESIYTGCLLESTFLGGIVCVALSNLPWSQEKIYIWLSVCNRSQSFPLLSRRFPMNINLTPALTASSHLFTKINLKHTLKTNS